jgi:hypothetical protein
LLLVFPNLSPMSRCRIKVAAVEFGSTSQEFGDLRQFAAVRERLMALALTIVCTSFGTDVRPNWQERPARASITGKQWQ